MLYVLNFIEDGGVRLEHSRYYFGELVDAQFATDQIETESLGENF